MRVLVLYCHPVETSFHAALHRRVVQSLRGSGHEVDDCDLYAEGFDPVLSREERLHYRDTARNTAGVASHVERLRAAEGLVLCTPIWCFGVPAMLKGYFDRVLVPGVGFDISDPSHVRSGLTHLRCIDAIVTYGRPRWMAWAMGDPPRKVVTRYLKALSGPRARIRYHARYHMNVATAAQLETFSKKVEAAMHKLPRS